MKRLLVSAASAVLMICVFSANAGAKHKKSSAQGNNGGVPGQFDFYLLNLSWAPEFCATHQSSQSASECDPSRHYGFVVHGLWPQRDDGSYPMECAPAQPVAQQTVQHMLAYIPARGLIQHEWAEHGTCSGLSSQDYFGRVEQAYKELRVPAEYQHPPQGLRLAPGELEQKFADANSAPKSAFRVSCSNGELVAIEACYTKDLQFRDCGAATRDCRAAQVLIRPTP